VRLSFITLILFCFLQVSSQSRSAENIFYSCRVIEKDAQVDTTHWLAYLDQNLQLDSLAMDTIPPGIYGITVIFIIDKKGCLTEVKALNDPGYGLGIRVIRVISGYEQWIPAERNGRKVRAYRKQVVTIISGKEKCKRSEFIL